jgi:hypothetical protein
MGRCEVGKFYMLIRIVINIKKRINNGASHLVGWENPLVEIFPLSGIIFPGRCDALILEIFRNCGELCWLWQNSLYIIKLCG